MPNCPQCQAEYPDGRKFCGGCGAALPQAAPVETEKPAAQFCPACGAEAVAGKKFCGACGAAVDGSASPPPEPSTTSTKPVAARKSKKGLFFFVGVVLLALLGGAAYFFLAGPGRKSTGVDDVSEASIRELGDHDGPICVMTFSPDGSLLATGGVDATCKLWRIPGGELVQNLNVAEEDVNALAFSPDGTILASGSGDDLIRLWSVDSGEKLASFEGGAGPTWELDFSPDGKRLAVAGLGVVQMWDLENEGRLWARESFTGNVLTVDFSPDGRAVIAGGEDGNIWRFDAETGGEIDDPLYQPDSLILTLRLLGDRFVAAVDGGLGVLKTETGELVREVEPDSPVLKMEVSDDGRFVFAGCDDGSAELWDVETGKRLKRFPRHSDAAYSVSITGSGNYAASAGIEDSQFRLWHLSGDEPVSTRGTASELEPAPAPAPEPAPLSTEKATPTPTPDAEKTTVMEPPAIPPAEEPSFSEWIRTASGLEYQVIQHGTGRRPLATDQVKLNYHGTLVDGTVFDGNTGRDEPATFPLDKMIEGWIEGLQLMKEGGRMKMRIPPGLAYGKKGRPPVIGPDQTLLYDIELIEVVATDRPPTEDHPTVKTSPSSETRPAAAARRTPVIDLDGLKIAKLSSGDSYFGQFAGDVRHGWGRYDYAESKNLFSGYWEVGEKRHGTLFFGSNGDAYTGRLENNLAVGGFGVSNSERAVTWMQHQDGKLLRFKVSAQGVESINNAQWNEITHVLNRDSPVYIYLDNKYINPARLTVWVVATCPQDFAVQPFHLETREDDWELNGGSAVDFTPQEVAKPAAEATTNPPAMDLARLRKMLAAGVVSEAELNRHLQAFTFLQPLETDGVSYELALGFPANRWIYRLQFEANDHGYWTSFVLSFPGPVEFAIGKAELDSQGGEDVTRASLGYFSQPE